VGIEKVKGGHKNRTELLNVLGEDTLPGGNSDSVQTGTWRRELFEFWNLKEESTKGSSQGC
jgi:hypothetical protein